MSEISDLESRISAAMDRISRGLEALPAAADDAGDELEEVRAQLDNEKLANTQLEERIKTLNAKLEDTEAALTDARDSVEKAAEAREAAEGKLSDAQQAHKDELAAAEAKAAEAAETVAAQPAIDLDENRDTLNELGKRLRRLRQTSRQVRGTNQELRDAATNGLSDHTHINKSLQAELENLKAMRAAELAEMDVILATLRPMLDADTASTEQEDA